MFSGVSSVSHHDPELTFNHSFIEQPSSGWVTDSFETDEDGEAVYCEPPREGKAVYLSIFNFTVTVSILLWLQQEFCIGCPF